MHAYAVALIKGLQGLAGAISTSAETTTGRSRGTVATPMAVRAWLPVSVPYRSMMSSENWFIAAVVMGAGCDLIYRESVEAVLGAEFSEAGICSNFTIRDRAAMPIGVPEPHFARARGIVWPERRNSGTAGQAQWHVSTLRAGSSLEPASLVGDAKSV